MPVIILRSAPEPLSFEAVQTLLKQHDFFCRECVWTKFFCNPHGRGRAHSYQPQTIQGDLVVLAPALGLMWQQGGSDELMEFQTAKEWVTALNQQRYAGFKDWRLPTLPEAMSLMVRKMKHDLYLDPIFDRTQWWIWTADRLAGAAAAWVVVFNFGICYPDNFYYNRGHYVRAVRSELSEQS
ncbi:DUF1566 domain-containing protein [candidate division KSB1 bacterium]|nr:DUF1566 domain-containing protein [candidate division KSB1 bacterium]